MPLSDLTEPAKLDLVLYAGDSFARTFTLKESDGSAIDLTGLTGRAQVRDRAGGRLLAEFTVNVTPLTGTIEVSLTATQTRALLAGGVWDLELDGGDTNTHTIVAGKVKVHPDVTIEV
jgi:hypothetical protein